MKMHKHAIYLIFLLCFPTFSFSQEVKIFGYVRDSLTGETLVGANVYNPNNGCTTNSYGFFSLEIPKNKATIVEISFVGYKKKQINVLATQNTELKIALAINDTLRTVEVIERKSTEIRHGVITLPVETLKSIPTLGGEPDILKALSFLPGIATGTEGTSGLYVRGGSPDQNLLLLDDAIVYNTSHLFGFMSILNPNAIKSVNVYKGGFPARYGGRLSSVIDVTMKEGNNKEHKMEGSIGYITSNLVAEGPIQKEKSSYMISGRAAYLGLFTLPNRWAYIKNGSTSYFNIAMYDINAKVNFQLPRQQKLFLSCYLGHDYFDHWEREFGSDNRFSLEWGNKTASLRYINVLSPNLFANATLNYNQFAYQTLIHDVNPITQKLNFDLYKSATVEDVSAKLNFEWYKEKHNIKFGLDIGQHFFKPNQLIFTSTADSTTTTKTNTEGGSKPQTLSLFAEDDWTINSFLSVNLGLRMLNYFTPTKNYNTIEPRAIFSFRLNPKNNIDVSFTKMGQFVHLLSASTGALGNDIWVPSTEGVPLETAQQVALSYSHKWLGAGWDFQFETYYKTSEGLIDYRQGANLFFFDKNWEQIIEKNGKGKAYGFEWFLKKEGQKSSGWLSYTLSWSDRQFQNINGGSWYPQRYDRRHNLNLVYEQKLSKKWTLNADFVFQTGSVVTVPTAVFKNQDGFPTTLYTLRNNARLPNYHRLDLAFSRKYTTKRGREAKWSFSMYNVYGQRNPFALNYTLGINNLPNGGKSYFSKTSLDSPFRFIPGLNWSIKF